MTQYPEATLARELGICYATVAVVTDYDSGLHGVAEVEPANPSENLIEKTGFGGSHVTFPTPGASS